MGMKDIDKEEQNAIICAHFTQRYTFLVPKIAIYIKVAIFVHICCYLKLLFSFSEHMTIIMKYYIIVIIKNKKHI